MQTTEKSKKVLNFSAAIGIIFISVSTFLYVLNYSPAKADNQNLRNNNTLTGFVPVGIITRQLQGGQECRVVGYNASTGEIKVLAKKDLGW